MAEGGGIGPRSNEGTAAYKAAPSCQLVALRSSKSKLTTARFASLPKRSANRAFVLSPNSTVNMGWNQAATLRTLKLLSLQESIGTFFHLL